MPNYTPNLNLVKPLVTEQYDIAKVTNDNADKIDLLLAPKANPTFTGTVSGITKAMVGLGNVDNTSDANKPISTATQTALNDKLSLTGGTLTGALNGTTITTSSNINGQNLKIRGDALEEYKTDGEAQVSINYWGYNSGTTQFRNFGIFDGKNSQVAKFQGSDKSLTLNGNLNTNGQIKFPATQNPSADANTLDDYEEGTWTPTISSSGTTQPTITSYLARNGKYVKIGKMVMLQCYIRATITNVGDGTPIISGFPFNIVSPNETGVSIGVYDLFSTKPPQSYLFSGYMYNNGVSFATSTYSTSVPNGYITFNTFYITDN